MSLKKVKDGLDSVVFDLVGHGFILFSGVSAIINNYSDAANSLRGAIYGAMIGGIAGGISHYYEIHCLNTRFRDLIKKIQNKPVKLARLDNFFSRLYEGSWSDKYTVYLYNRQRKKVIY